MYLMLAVELTSLARRFVPPKLWRRVHFLSLPLFALSTVHFVATGTDAGEPVRGAGIVISSLAVAVACCSGAWCSRPRARAPLVPGRVGPGSRARARPGPGIGRISGNLTHAGFV